MVTFNWLSVGGGVTKYVAGLTDQLRRRTDLRVVIVAADPQAADGGVVVSGSGLGLTWSTWRALRRVRPQVIHCHGHIWMGVASAAYKWSRGNRCKLIYSLHTKIESPDRDSSRSWRGRLTDVVRRVARQALHAVIVRHSDAVTAVSKAMADDLTAVDRVRPRAQIQVVPPGVEINEPAAREVEAFRERYGLVGKFPIIVSIGLLHYPWKVEGHECLISALAILRARYPEARLVLVGDGRYRRRVEQCAAEAGVGDRVIVTGYLDAPGRALAVADVYGHLATNEAFGIAIVEAMLYGKPVVAADRGGIPEVIAHQQTGLLIAPRPDAVAEAIVRVLENREWSRALGERARHVAARAYTWEAAVQRFAAMYGGAVAR
jgi:glycosyltransferase involved in cell wall biosynthesis